MTPASADGVISAVDPGKDTLTTFATKNGKTLAALPLEQPPAGTITAAPAANTELVYVAGRTYALAQSGKSYVWTAATPALPTLSTAGVGAVHLAVPATGGIALLDATTGKPTATFPVPAPAAGSQVYEYGTGFIVAGRSTVVYR